MFHDSIHQLNWALATGVTLLGFFAVFALAIYYVVRRDRREIDRWAHAAMSTMSLPNKEAASPERRRTARRD